MSIAVLHIAPACSLICWSVQALHFNQKTEQPQLFVEPCFVDGWAHNGHISFCHTRICPGEVNQCNHLVVIQVWLILLHLVHCFNLICSCSISCTNLGNRHASTQLLQLNHAAFSRLGLIQRKMSEVILKHLPKQLACVCLTR